VASVAPIQAPDQGLDFGAISALSPEELDGLPYGMITLDAAGRVIHYNDTESRLVGLPKERVIGRNFFQDIAPCTRLREFEGRFRELVLDPTRVRVKTFDFVFRFPRGDQHVTVVMTPAKVRGRFHLALLRRSIDG
jgi:photoactive yellow protein